MNKKKKSSILLIVAIIILLSLFILANYIINKNLTDNYYNEMIQDNSYIEDSFHVNKKGKYTGYCGLGLTHFLDINARYPRLKFDKDNAIKLNDKILKDNKQLIDFIKTDNIDIYDNKNKTTLLNKISYNYLIKDNIIFIALNSNYVFDNNKNYYKLNNYYYDFKNDKILTFEDIIKQTDFTIDDFKKIDTNKEINTLEDCNNICKFKIKDNNLIPYIDKPINN